MSTEEITWPGGRGRITVEGDFLTGGGVSTVVTLTHRARQPDGSLRDGTVVRSFSSPGTHDVALSPGVCAFVASGPDGLPWEVRAKFEPIPRAPKKPTLEQRLAAAERRINEMTGLDAAASGRAN